MLHHSPPSQTASQEHGFVYKFTLEVSWFHEFFFMRFLVPRMRWEHAIDSRAETVNASRCHLEGREKQEAHQTPCTARHRPPNHAPRSPQRPCCHAYRTGSERGSFACHRHSLETRGNARTVMPTLRTPLSTWWQPVAFHNAFLGFLATALPE